MITRRYREHTAGEIEILNRAQAWARFRLSDFLGVAFITTILFAGGGWFVGKGLDYLAQRLVQSFDTPVFAPSLLAIGLLCTIVSIVRGGSDEERRPST